MLADAIPCEIARTFIMFAKTGTFTPAEVTLARSLNSPSKERVILWQQDQLEPYLVYEREKSSLKRVRCGFDQGSELRPVQRELIADSVRVRTLNDQSLATRLQSQAVESLVLDRCY